MKLPEFLEKQLLDFVDVYKKYYKKTFSVTILLTIICFLICSVLFSTSTFAPETKDKPELIWSFFFNRYSKNGIYCTGDLIKEVFTFFVSIFTVSLYRFKRETISEDNFAGSFLKTIKAMDVVLLFVTFVACGAIDYLLVKLTHVKETASIGDHTRWIVSNFIFRARIFLPLLLFGLATAFRLGDMRSFNVKKLAFLFISVWLFNEFSYESMLMLRGELLSVLLLPFYKTDYYFLIENICCIPFTAFYFLGFSSALAYSMETLNEETNIDALAIKN